MLDLNIWVMAILKKKLKKGTKLFFFKIWFSPKHSGHAKAQFSELWGQGNYLGFGEKTKIWGKKNFPLKRKN